MKNFFKVVVGSSFRWVIVTGDPEKPVIVADKEEMVKILCQLYHVQPEDRIYTIPEFLTEAATHPVLKNRSWEKPFSIGILQ